MNRATTEHSISATSHSTASAATLRRAATAWAEPMVDFAQRLVRTPSPSGHEETVAQLLADEFRRLGYDDVWIDRAGNAIGVVKGTGSGTSLQFNTHLDHVSAGDPALWSRPAFDGTIQDGVLFGRGACDVKGAMAAQAYLIPVLRDAGYRLDGDVFVVGVVLEEVGGFGSRYLAQTQPTDIAVVGEASGNQLRRGHCGRSLVRVTFTGQSTHASAPERGRNPHFAVARFLLELESLAMEPDATFGGSSAAPTLIETDQTSGNVTPGSVSVFLDWRTVPSETEDAVIAKLDPLLRRVEESVEGVRGNAEPVGRPVRSYTGMTATMPSTRGFETAADDLVLARARVGLENALGRPVTDGTWTFATDGGHLSHHGITTIGFAPGEERFAHTIHDQCDIAKMHEALLGNAALALDLTRLPKKDR